jgi:hypothetical protein
VFKINFKPNFDSDVNEQLYYMYLMEKWINKLLEFLQFY